jgi:hypothetical protein
MKGDDAELDRLQSANTAAVDTWVTAVRGEEQLASVHHSMARKSMRGRMLTSLPKRLEAKPELRKRHTRLHYGFAFSTSISAVKIDQLCTQW